MNKKLFTGRKRKCKKNYLEAGKERQKKLFTGKTNYLQAVRYAHHRAFTKSCSGWQQFFTKSPLHC